MKKVVPMFRHYPFFFKPIQDGTTNPRMELAFREPSKRITKNNKTSSAGDALNTVLNWKNTTNNAYDGEKLHMLYMDEAGKWERPSDIREAWRIERTCLIVGRRIVGKAKIGSQDSLKWDRGFMDVMSRILRFTKVYRCERWSLTGTTGRCNLPISLQEI